MDCRCCGEPTVEMSNPAGFACLSCGYFLDLKDAAVEAALNLVKDA